MTTLSAKSVSRPLISSLVAVEPDPRATHSATHITGVLGLWPERTTAAPCAPLFSSSIALVGISLQPLAARLAPQVTVPFHSLPIRVGDVTFLENCLKIIFKPLALSSLQTGTLSHFAVHHLTWKPTLRHPVHVTSPPLLALCEDAFQGDNTSPLAYFQLRDSVPPLYFHHTLQAADVE